MDVAITAFQAIAAAGIGVVFYGAVSLLTVSGIGPGRGAYMTKVLLRSDRKG